VKATRWASPVIDSQAGQIFQSARSNGPVSLIATPWSAVVTRPVAWATGEEASRELLDFDQVPLTSSDGLSVQSIYVRGVGVLPVHAGMFMAANAPLLAFVETADRQRFRLLVEGGEIFGLVTLSDLQRLPVNTLLFGIVIAVEALLVEWIRDHCRDDRDKWLRFLGRQRQGRIERYYRESMTKNVAIDCLSCASFTDKVEAAIGLGLLARMDVNHVRLEALVELRNDICHVKEFAGTPELALQVPLRARDCDSLAQWLLHCVNLQRPARPCAAPWASSISQLPRRKK
jgi:hypothetical protein